jgi:murein L,D-transpeptidase YafK
MTRTRFGAAIGWVCRVTLWMLLCNICLAIDNDYDILISKSKQQLNVVNGEQIVKQYRIAYGKGGNGTKRELGDKKTPIGVYKIVDFKDDSRFHYFMHLDYPNLLDAWYGYKNKTISADEFKKIAHAVKHRKKPPQDTRLGGYIGIHGLGNTTENKLKIHDEINWTEGCIALTNEQIDDLKKYVTIGTKVVIRE